MNNKIFWVTLLFYTVLTLFLFYFFQKQLSNALLGIELQPQVKTFLQESQEDLKQLSQLDPNRSDHYRARFTRIQKEMSRYQVLAINRDNILKRFRFALVGLVALMMLTMGVLYAWNQKQLQKRVAAIKMSLEALSNGQLPPKLTAKSGDALGLVSEMVYKTALMMANKDRRLKSLENLSAWQEAARRHAHEIRTPLTAVQLEINHFFELVRNESFSVEVIDRTQESITEEMTRLKEFTQQFTSFAKIGKPKMKKTQIEDFISKFCRIFEGSWPNLKLINQVNQSVDLNIDREQIRQVLVNLCNNASLALHEQQGEIVISLIGSQSNWILTISDNGPGIVESVGERLFEPYVTSRQIGEGMGLGLPIARKIMLDHDGDLTLGQTGPNGTTFQLHFPKQEFSRDKDFNR